MVRTAIVDMERLSILALLTVTFRMKGTAGKGKLYRYSFEEMMHDDTD